VDRVAFLTVDNLSGDDSLSWMRDAIPVMAGTQLAGVGKIVPVRGSDSTDAARERAQHIVHGYFDQRGGKLHFEFSIEDAATHEMRPVIAEGGALEAATALSKAIDSGARPFSTSNAEALAAWGRRDFARATELDPDFGQAWLDWVQSVGAVQPGVAQEAAAKALARPTLRSEVDRARLQLLAAQLAKDDAGISKAGAELSAMLPKDGGLARMLGERESIARHYAEAVRLLQRAAAVEPEEFATLNTLGYAQFFAGDLEGARKSFQAYGKHPGQEANAADSEGEILFMAGKFTESENLFRKAHNLKPEMLQGGDLQKAAYARWLGGDMAGADRIFEEFLKYRLDNKDKITDWRRGVWYYATGRAPQAVTALEKIQGEIAPLAQQQIAFWANMTKIDQPVEVLEPLYRQATPPNDGLIRTLYARALWRANREAEAAQLAKLWPLPPQENGNEILVQGLQYPLYQELQKTLAKK
jgi:Flp pilus assembly protein TadD